MIGLPGARSGSFATAETYSPFAVFTIASFGTPEFPASPRNSWPLALVRRRSSYATDFGGPITSRTTSSWRRRTPCAIAVNRLGPPKASIRLLASINPFVEKYFSSIACKLLYPLPTIPAGSSSHPISKRKSPAAGLISFSLFFFMPEPRQVPVAKPPISMQRPILI